MPPSIFTDSPFPASALDAEFYFNPVSPAHPYQQPFCRKVVLVSCSLRVVVNSFQYDYRVLTKMQVPHLDLTESDMDLADHRFYRTPQMIVYYVTFLLALFVIITASCIFIEFVAAFTKKCIDIVADHLTCDFASVPNPRAVQTEPRMLKHQLLDKTCPLTSGPLDELSDKEETPSLRTPGTCSPCGICYRPLTMGDLTRRFPCKHRFHARCVDKACIVDEECEKPVRVPGAYLQCPVCFHVIFPTPDLMTNCVISVE